MPEQGNHMKQFVLAIILVETLLMLTGCVTGCPSSYNGGGCYADPLSYNGPRTTTPFDYLYNDYY